MPSNPTNPWADATNQAVGALYKYYMTQPTAADALKNQYMQSQIEQNTMKGQMNQRLYDMGGWDGAPAAVQTQLYALQHPDQAQTVYNLAHPAVQVDLGDRKQLVSPINATKIFDAYVGTAPEMKVNKDETAVLPIPGMPSQGVMGGQAPQSPMGNLFASLIQQESGGDPMAVSPAGASGIAQIMPDTARDPGYGVSPLQGWDGQDPRTAPVEEQLRFGQDYLNAMIQNNGGDVSKGLASYNAGPGRVAQAVETGGNDWLQHTPQETQNYVPSVMGGAGQSIQPIPLGKTGDIAKQENDKNLSTTLGQDDLNNTFAQALTDIQKGGAGLGSYMKDIPFIGGQTAAGNLEADLSKITNKAAIDKIAQLKEESKTGGFFGNLSDGERQAVADSQLAIRQSMNPQDLAYRLIMHQDLVNDIVNGRGKVIPGTNQVVPMDAGAPRSGLPTLVEIQNATTPQELEAMWNAFDKYPVFEGRPPQDIDNALADRYNQLRGGQ